MAYELVKSDGTTLIELADGITDTGSASITFVGKNVVNYGLAQNENFLHLLEHFSSANEPLNKITGQLWFDKGNRVLKLYNIDRWQPLATMAYSATSTNAVSYGNFWFDSTNQQLYVKTPSGNSLVGPEKAPGFGETKMKSVSLYDTSDVLHPVIEFVVGDEVVAIVSNSAFDIGAVNSVAGFNSIVKGINFKNPTTTGVILNGYSKYTDSADKLKSSTGSSYISAASDATGSTIAQRDSLGGSKFSTVYANTLTSIGASASLAGTWIVNDVLRPDANNGADLGTSSEKWGNLYSTTASLGTISFGSLVDSSGTSVTGFDTDTGLSADSDSKIATQKAVKKYIDEAISAEATARITSSTSIQVQVNTTLGVPVGSVFYIAGPFVPVGYLEANGAAVSKTEYTQLYNILGGAGSPYGQTSTHFNLPDLRGEFIRGWDHSRGVDGSRTLGSSQTDQIESHNHQMLWTNYTGGGGSGLTDPVNPLDVTVATQTAASTGRTGWGVTFSGGTETRPRNVALMPIIKY